MLRSKHGYSRTKAYRAWQDAKARCYNEESTEFIRYGAKGISMSDEFLNNPEAWCEYLGNPPDNTSRKWSVDRIDSCKGYERGNLKWATADTQARNHRKSSNNTSGHTGVTFYIRNKLTYCIAWWEEAGAASARSKCFSVNKYGLMQAFAKAVSFRQSKITELNNLGYGYSFSLLNLIVVS
jgi:hypothetical protein